MSAHLKQAIVKVSQVGHELAKQVTGDDLSDLRKAQLLDDLLYEMKQMADEAIRTLEVPEGTFDDLKGDINSIGQDGEIARVIEKLEEATDEPADGPGRDYIELV